MIRGLLCATLLLLTLQTMPVAGREEQTTPTSTPITTQAATPTPVPITSTSTSTSTSTPTPTPTATSTPAHPGVVSGVVFHDRDLDGVRDINEEALPGWEIDAGTSDNVNAGRMALTDADGAYRIEDVDSSLSNWQLDVYWPFETPFTHFYKVELPQPKPFNFKQTSLRIDVPVAYADDSKVTFRVWEDFDGDGTISAGNELALYTDVVITDPSGAFVFEGSGALSSLTVTGLLPGDYVAEAAIDPLNRIPFTISKRKIPMRPVELLSKLQVTLYGYVYEDSDQSGTYDPGEPRIPNAEVDAEVREGNGGSGTGVDAGPDGSYVVPFASCAMNQTVYIGCGNAPPLEPSGSEPGTDQQGHWQGTRGMTYTHQQLWMQDYSFHIGSPGHFRIDCGLVWIPPLQRSPSAAPSPPRPGGDAIITLPPSGTGDEENRSFSIWLALAVVGSGAVLAGWAVRSKGWRPGRGRTGPRHR